MNVNLTLPDSLMVSLNQDREEFINEAKKIIALFLFSKRKISLGQAAELSGLNLYPFMIECHRNSIDLADSKDGEVAKDVNFLRGLRSKDESCL